MSLVCPLVYDQPEKRHSVFYFSFYIAALLLLFFSFLCIEENITFKVIIVLEIQIKTYSLH